jgi:hypothetical protein
VTGTQNNLSNKLKKKMEEIGSPTNSSEKAKFDVKAY